MQRVRGLFVLACCVIGVYGAWQWSRSYVAREIGVRAEHHPATARAALSELRSLGIDAVPALLDAAISPDRQVARPARQEIEGLLITWAARRHEPIDEKFLLVVELLLEREPSLTPSGRRWARQLGDTVLRLAESTRESLEPLLVEKVERLFAVSQQVSQVSDYPLHAPSVRAAQPPVSFAPRLVENPSALSANQPEVRQPSALVTDTELSRGSEAESLPPPDAVAHDVTEQEPTEPARLPEATKADSDPPKALGPPDLAWRKPGAVHDSQPNESDAPAEPLPPTERPPVPQEVQQLLAGREADRLQLVEELLSGKHQDAVKFLFKLAKDPSPRVRASAISALGTSSNPQLTLAAWRLALHDEHPHVARLASELEKLIR